jgi:hypothetical protein
MADVAARLLVDQPVAVHVEARTPQSAAAFRGRYGPAVDFAERAARNEEVFRGINERIEAGAELHAIETPERFHCECDRGGCFEMVELRPGDYRELLERRYHFVVAPDHADPRVERVLEERDGYWVVEKVGEAREALDRQHPHERHQS